MGRRRRTSKKKKGFGAAGFLLLVLLTGAVGGAGWLVLTPYGPHKEIFVDLPTGSSTLSIGRRLERAHVVRSQYAFDLMRWWKRGTLHAGEYRFDHPASVIEVYTRIARGDVATKTVTIPEGSSIFEIADRLEEAGLAKRADFLAAAQQGALVADLDPKARSLEGFLFPDTYRFSRKSTPEQICATMVHRFRTVASEIGLKENAHSVVTMASLVERESAVASERPLVASVFANRLEKHMALGTDPSVIYGLELENRWRGTIYKSDLATDTPYNTYLHAGLPPGPIANPGRASLRAALAPAQTNYLYFVAAGANPQGRSLFAATLDEHNHNVAGYRRAMKKAGER